MSRVLHGAGLVAGILACLGPGHVFGAQAESPAESPKIIALLPGNFKGWACIDFGVAGSLPLPREGDTLVARFRQGEVLKTSDKPGEFPRFYEAWFEINGQRRPLPHDFQSQREVVQLGDCGQPVQRYCAFYGTEDEADAAAEPPGFEPSPNETKGVSEEERRVLVALYKATDGDHWNHHVGWLGPPGTECKWHGVRCWSRHDQPTTAVTELDLSQNNLVGSIPEALGQLSHLKDLELWENNLVGAIPQALGQLARLEELRIFGNHFSGMLPPELIQRWLAGALEISAEAPLLTDVTKIEFERDPSALLCGRRRIALDSGSRALLFTKCCRKATPEDRTTFCEVKEGRAGAGQFASLAWLLEKNGFYDLRAKYTRNVTDVAYERTRVIRGGKRFEVENYAAAGPFELWVIQTAIEGVASSIEWEKTSTQPECPEWDQPAASQHE